MILEHLPALLVLVPLVAAPICALTPGNRIPWVIATLASWGAFALSITAVMTVSSAGAISYEMGGWAPPWGIEYRIDALNAYVALAITAIAAVVMPYALSSVAHELEEGKSGGYYAAYLLALTGLLGITTTGDVFNLFVFLEISSLASYILVSQGSDRRALVAAFRYLVAGTVGATFLLIGVGLLYAMTGTLNMEDLAQRLPEVSDSRTVHTAFAFIAVGSGIKMAMFPLHQWLPGAYAQAPSVASAFLAGTATKAALYVLIRFVYSIFGVEFVFDSAVYAPVLVALALAATVSASVSAIGQSDVKRLLAYSSIAQIGYILLGIGMGTAAGLSAAILHLFNHALIKTAVFLAAGAFFYRLGSTALARLEGVGREMPWTAMGFALAGLGLIGVPLTAGFVSKWYLVVAALERGWWPVAVVVLFTSLLALVYVWKVVETMWFSGSTDNREAVREAPLSLLVPIWLLVLAVIYFGVFTEVSVGLAQQAAQALMSGGPR